MGKMAKPDEVNFNYPIPRPLHSRVRSYGVMQNMYVKDILIAALTFYLDAMEEMENREEEL